MRDVRIGIARDVMGLCPGGDPRERLSRRRFGGTTVNPVPRA